jgi:hypothetical protein
MKLLWYKYLHIRLTEAKFIRLASGNDKEQFIVITNWFLGSIKSILSYDLCLLG